MVFEIIVAAIMIAFGAFAVFISMESGNKDEKTMVILLIGTVLTLLGGWIIITTLTVALVLQKLGSIILAIIGLFLIFGFPDSGDYQSVSFSITGVLIGLIFLVIGAYFLFF